MADCMEFPDTIEEFMEQYKVVDTEQVYSNSTEYVPIFRMNQWLEHENARKGLKWIEKICFNGSDTHDCTFYC